MPMMVELLLLLIALSLMLWYVYLQKTAIVYPDNHSPLQDRQEEENVRLIRMNALYNEMAQDRARLRSI